MRHSHTPVLLTAPNLCFLPGTSGTLFSPLFPNFGIRTLCDLDGLSRVPMPRHPERQQAAHPVKVHGEPRDSRASGGERSRKRSGKGRAGVECRARFYLTHGRHGIKQHDSGQRARSQYAPIFSHSQFTGGFARTAGRKETRRSFTSARTAFLLSVGSFLLLHILTGLPVPSPPQKQTEIPGF